MFGLCSALARGKRQESCFTSVGTPSPPMPEAFPQLPLLMPFYVPSAWHMVGTQYVASSSWVWMPSRRTSLDSCRPRRPAGTMVLRLRSPAFARCLGVQMGRGHRAEASHLTVPRLPPMQPWPRAEHHAGLSVKLTTMQGRCPSVHAEEETRWPVA